MPDCPAGSQPQAPWGHQVIWATLEDICEAMPWLPNQLNIRCEDLIPKLIDLDVYCDSPPPVVPDLDWWEIARAGPSFSTLKLFIDWIWTAWENVKWDAYCECSPVIGPGTCPPVPKWTVVDSSGGAHGLHPVGPFVPMPHGWTAFSARAWNNDTTGSLTTIYGRFYDAAQTTVLGQFSLTPDLNSSQTTVDFTAALAGVTPAEMANLRYIRMWIQASGAIASHSMSLEIYEYEGLCEDQTVTPPPPTPPPLPDDPGLPVWPVGPASCTIDTLCSMLLQVTYVLNQNARLINILQRYGLPFGYVKGPSHPGLSGSGSFPISGLVGLQVDITSPLPGRQLEGTPPYLWDLGWMSVMTPDGMIQEQRITRDTQLWQPRVIQEATVFGYFFKNDTVATVTELQPEPY